MFEAIDGARYDASRLLFFADKDYSDFLGEIWPVIISM